MSSRNCNCSAIPLPRKVALWVAILSNAAFILISADVINHGLLQQLDIPIARWVAEHRPPVDASHKMPLSITIASLFTQLGSVPMIGTAAAIAAVYLTLKRNWRLMIWGAVTLIGEPIINYLLKSAFALPRPTLETSVYELNRGFTYPSGHTMAVAVTYGIIAAMCVEFFPRISKIAWAALMIFCLLFGIAMLYIGVHYLSDLLGAYAVSACWLGIMLCVPGAPKAGLRNCSLPPAH